MSKRKQDDLTRQRRLNDGCCPTHGIPLVCGEVLHNDFGVAIGMLFDCPRGDCPFQYDPPRNSKTWKALYPKRSTG